MKWGKSLKRRDGVEVWIGDRMYFFLWASPDEASVRDCEMRAGAFERERLAAASKSALAERASFGAGNRAR
jgi:hypothetical protein